MAALSSTPASRRPWVTGALVLAAFVIQCVPAWRDALLYDRAGLAHGELWRVWTGHLVHFGWPHLVVDAGLLAILGWFAERDYPAFTRWGCLLMPAFVSAAIYVFDPSMVRYGGLSALNLGLLLYFVAQGWRKDWTDWFWPAVIAAYAGELAFEYYRGGHGGGAIRFDDASIQVATGAHVASAAYALLALALTRILVRKSGRGSPTPGFSPGAHEARR